MPQQTCVLMVSWMVKLCRQVDLSWEVQVKLSVMLSVNTHL